MGAAFFATQFSIYDSGAEALGSCQARRLLIPFPCCWELSLQVLEFLFTCFQQEMLMIPIVYLFLSFLKVFNQIFSQACPEQ